jgi:hypothetical protein
MERAIPLLSPDEPPERRELTVRTAFRGPGARDAFEFLTRAVSEDRFTIDPSLERAELGPAARFVFVVGYRGRSVTLCVRDGYVTREFIDLANRADRTPEEERALTAMKRQMAAGVMAGTPQDVYDVTDSA